MEYENMSKELVEYLVGLGEELRKEELEPCVRQFFGKDYILNRSCNRFTLITEEKHDEPMPATFPTFTLKGLVDFIKTDIEGLFSDPKRKALVTVESPSKVSVYLPCSEAEKKRYCVASCHYGAPDIRFDRYMDAEDAGIMLMTNFDEDQNRNTVLSVIQNMKEEQSESTADDGISQRVTIKRGIVGTDSTIFRNPAYLRPHRTFVEVEQPCSPFVVRFKDGHQAAIFESDGGAWKVTAVQNIGKWLSDQLAGTNVIVIA